MTINYSKQILLKRGNTAVSATYTGPIGEITLDTDLLQLRVHDGNTAGGFLAASQLNLNSFKTYANANAAIQTTEIDSLRANITAANSAITSLTSNAAIQTTEIDSLRANITAANSAITSLTSNAAIQAALLDTLTANAATQSTVLDTLTANAATQANTLDTLTSNAATQAALLDTLTANAATQSTALDTLTANAATQSTALDTLTSNAAIQADLLDTLTANAAIQANTLDTLTANAAIQADLLDTLTSNAATQANTLDTLLGNAITQQTSLIDLLANAATQSQQIANVTGTYSNTNVAAYLSAFDGNIIPAANVTYSLGSATHQWKDLWVSNNTIYIGNTPIRVDGGTLLVDGAPVSLGFDQNLNTTDNVTFANIGITNGQISLPTDTDFALRLNHSTFGEANVIVNSQGYMEVTGGYVGRSFTQILPGEVGATGYFGFTGNITNISGINGLILDTGLEGSGGTWTFDTNSDLTVPGYVKFKGNTYIGDEPGSENPAFRIVAPLGYGATIETDSDITGNSWTWTFGVDGTLGAPGTITAVGVETDTVTIGIGGSITFPDTTVQTTAWTGTVNFGNTIAIGYNTGTVSQGSGAVAIGSTSGNVSQGIGAVAVGEAAGRLSQGVEGIAIGKTAGEQSQGSYSIAIGSATAYYQQGTGAVAIGTSAGALQQGTHAIAIGTGAGNALQGNNSIILNATGSMLDQTTDNTFTVAPIRNTGGVDGVLQYNNSTKEVSYSSTLVGNLSVTGNITQQSAYYETYANVTNSGGNLTCNFVNGATFYAALNANVTVNFTNVVATAGQVTGATLIVDQGATPYSVANIQINDGAVQTVKWAGGTINAGTASNTDVMSFSLISLDGTSWRVLGQITNYA